MKIFSRLFATLTKKLIKYQKICIVISFISPCTQLSRKFFMGGAKCHLECEQEPSDESLGRSSQNDNMVIDNRSVHGRPHCILRTQWSCFILAWSYAVFSALIMVLFNYHKMFFAVINNFEILPLFQWWKWMPLDRISDRPLHETWKVGIEHAVRHLHHLREMYYNMFFDRVSDPNMAEIFLRAKILAFPDGIGYRYFLLKKWPKNYFA